MSSSARKRNYLGASNTISTRETTASRSTLQAEKKRPVSLITTPRDRANTEGREGEAQGTYTLARRSGQASRSRFATGSSFSFFPSRARGTLNTSRALEWAEREWSGGTSLEAHDAGL